MFSGDVVLIPISLQTAWTTKSLTQLLLHAVLRRLSLLRQERVDISLANMCLLYVLGKQKPIRFSYPCFRDTGKEHDYDFVKPVCG